MRGFANLGNTCGINALIQCMFQSQYITTYLEKNRGKDFTSQFQHLWQLYQSDQPGILAPHGIIHVLQKFLANVFTSGQPVDVWEIWMFIWNLIADEMGNPNERLKEMLNQPEGDDLVTKSEKAFAKGIWQNFSPWTIYLQGMMITQVQCPKCQKCHHNFEHTIALSLEVPTQETSLEQCLKNMFEIEKVDWKCEDCRENFQAEKVCRLWRCPKLLVIALKRFVFNGHQWMKLETPISIPDTLTLGSHFIGIDKPQPYHLKGLCIHLGTCTGGHYMAQVKKGDSWYLCDDTSIDSCMDRDFKNAYLLFYEMD